MEWFKHSTGSHDDPDISDAWDELGDFGYVGFFVILEIYAQEFSHRNTEDFITISRTFLRRKLRKSWTKVELLLNFFSKKNRIISFFDNDKINIKVPKFIEVASNWSKRQTTELPTEVPTAIEEKRREEDIKEKNIKEKIRPPEKKKFLDEVYLTEDEYDRLVSDFGKEIVDRKILDLDGHIGSKGAKYKDHNKTIRNWLRRDGIIPKEKAPEQKPDKPQKDPVAEYIEKLKKNIKLCDWFDTQVKSKIAEMYEPIVYEQLFKDLVPILKTQNKLVLFTPQKWNASWIAEHYAKELQQEFGFEFEIRGEVPDA